jgi:hypothetical protein
VAHAPEVKLPVKADPSQFIAVIDVIEKHLTALRDELAALVEPGEVVHLCPEAGGAMRCCGLTPFDVPRSDRVTTDPQLVTCGGA